MTKNKKLMENNQQYTNLELNNLHKIGNTTTKPDKRLQPKTSWE